MAQLIWLITGATSGLGEALVRGLAARGDRVIATGRQAETRLASIKSEAVVPLDLDVASPQSEVESQIRIAAAIWGRIDVVVHNAGMAMMGSFEEVSEVLTAKIFEVNVFGPMRVTHAVLPYMRAQKSGTICFIGGGVGWAPYPFIGHYAMTKAALESYAEGISKELSPLGIRTVMFTAGGFAETRLGQPREGDSGAPVPPRIEAYQAGFGRLMQDFVAISGESPGDAHKVPDVIADVVRGEGLAKGRRWPMRVCLGSDGNAIVKKKCEEQLVLCEEWQDVARQTDKDDFSGVVCPLLLQVGSMLDDHANQS